MGLSCKKQFGKMKSIMKKVDNDLLREKQLQKRTKQKCVAASKAV